MNEPKKQFAKHLLACDKSPSRARQNYEKELRAMLENKLSAGGKREWLIGAIACGFGAALVAYTGVEAFRARTSEFHLPAFVGAYVLLTAAALLGVVVVLAIGVWRGGYQCATHRQVVAGIGTVYVGLTGWIFMVVSRHAPELLRNDLFVFGLVLVLYTATAWIRQRVGQAELKTREKLLEIELRVAGIAEALESKDAGLPGSRDGSHPG
jgi:hypothetical protein